MLPKAVIFAYILPVYLIAFKRQISTVLKR